MTGAGVKKRKKAGKKPYYRGCAACGLLESDNLVDGKRVPFRLDNEKRLICATCPLEPIEWD